MTSIEQSSAEAFEQAYEQYAKALNWKRRNSRKRKYEDTPDAGFVLLGTLACTISADLFMRQRSADSIEALCAVMLVYIAGCTIAIRRRRNWWKTAETVERDYNDAKRVLAQSFDTRAVGPLLEAFSAETITADIAFALMRLLPRLKRDDASLLTHSQRQHLYRLLQKPYSMNLALELAVVGVLEHVGDAATPAILARLLRNSDTPPPLAQAAQHCLHALNARSAQQNQTQTLLRAAPTPAAPAAHLLRPTQAAPPEDAPELLLRASGSGDMR